MFKKLIGVLLALNILWLAIPIAAASGEYIRFFDSNINVAQDGKALVTETIVYNFSTPRHGIFRNINTASKNQDGKRYEMQIDILGVTSLNGVPYKYTTSQGNDQIQIKIGDPNSTVSGVRTYVIVYEVSGALESFSDHDELYWNVTGNEWEVPIQSAKAVFSLPSSSIQNMQQVTCYTGSFGSTQKNCTALVENNKASFESSQLNAGEGLTIVAGFNKGVVPIISKTPIADNSWIFILLGFVWYILLPGSVVVFYFIFGRDPKVNTAIPALFEPPKDGNRRLTPGEAGTLVDESADNQDITATIVDLAIRGHLKIKETKAKALLNDAEYTLTRSEDYKVKDKNVLQHHEERILNGLFGTKDEVKTSTLKNKFADDSQKAKDFLYKNVVDNGFFPSNPKTIRTVWYLLGAFSLFTINIPFGIMCLLFAKAMPHKTLKGAKAQVEILGLKKFLSSQERQLEFQEVNWFMFEKLLPYAIAFNVTETWAKRFEHLQEVPQTDWYTGTHAFNTFYLASSLNSLNASVAQASTPTRSSSGYSSGFSGGFSGGGGGGGGGGSW